MKEELEKKKTKILIRNKKTNRYTFTYIQYLKDLRALLYIYCKVLSLQTTQLASKAKKSDAETHQTPAHLIYKKRKCDVEEELLIRILIRSKKTNRFTLITQSYSILSSKDVRASTDICLPRYCVMFLRSEKKRKMFF